MFSFCSAFENPVDLLGKENSQLRGPLHHKSKKASVEGAHAELFALRLQQHFQGCRTEVWVEQLKCPMVQNPACSVNTEVRSAGRCAFYLMAFNPL